MLEKLAKQTAVYGISTIAVRFLSYLLTPYYTRIFGQETYGVVTDIYALIPLALTLLTMGMESSYFRFSAKAEEAGGDVKAAKRRLFATTWGVTSLAAAVFFVVVAFFRDGISHLMGEAYVCPPSCQPTLGRCRGRQPGHFLEIASLFPPRAALRRFLRLQISCCQPRGNVIRYLHDDSSAASCGAGLAQWIPTNHVRRGTEQH